MNSKILIIIVALLILSLLAGSFIVFSKISAEIDDFPGYQGGSSTTDTEDDPEGGGTGGGTGTEGDTENGGTGGGTEIEGETEKIPFPTDESKEAINNVFVGVAGTYDGVVTGWLNVSGPPSTDVLYNSVVTVYEKNILQLNHQTSGWVSDSIGNVEFYDSVQFYYRAYNEETCEWESEAHLINGSNFIIYICNSTAPEMAGWGDPGSWFALPAEAVGFPSYHSTGVRLGLAEGFVPDFDYFLLYAY